MALAEFLAELEQFQADAAQAFASAADADALEAARIEFLGAKSGRLKTVQNNSARYPVPTNPQPANASTKSRPPSKALSPQPAERIAAGADEGTAATPFDLSLRACDVRWDICIR